MLLIQESKQRIGKQINKKSKCKPFTDRYSGSVHRCVFREALITNVLFFPVKALGLVWLISLSLFFFFFFYIEGLFF